MLLLLKVYFYSWILFQSRNHQVFVHISTTTGLHKLLQSRSESRTSLQHRLRNPKCYRQTDDNTKHSQTFGIQNHHNCLGSTHHWNLAFQWDQNIPLLLEKNHLQDICPRIQATISKSKKLWSRGSDALLDGKWEKKLSRWHYPYSLLYGTFIHF